MKNILVLDQSTSATKALFYDVSGQLLDKETIEHQQYYPRPGWVEHDAEEIWHNSLEVINKLIASHQTIIKNTICFSITNQRETFVIFDKQTGKPLHNAIVWQCRRGEKICSSHSEAGYDQLIHNQTGLKLDTYFSASKIQWLIQNEPEIKRKIRSGEALIGTIETYLIYRLTNGSVFATDFTNACRTLLFDIYRMCWSLELCNLFEIPFQALAEIRESSAQFGETSFNGILDRALPICGVIGDSQGSLFAQRCYTQGMAKVTLGTGSSLLLNIGNQPTKQEGSAVTTIGWVLNGMPSYSYEGIINYAAATISWLQNQLGLINNPEETEQMALSVDDNGGVYLVPAFAGLSDPYWKPEAKAAILGLTSFSNKNHIARAALESIAYQIKDVLDMMKSNADIALKKIYCDGGATNNRFLMQFISDITGLELNVSNTFELSPMGAVFFGTLGMGVYANTQDLDALSTNFTTYAPKMPEETSAKLYEGWADAIRRLVD